jgi:L-ascorbate metabolism protein UlaG (beta-lactamase superfamily)
MWKVYAGSLAGIVIAASAAFAAEPSDDKIPADKGDIAIHAFHHASLSLTWNGVTVLVDPAPLLGGTPAPDPTAEYKAATPPTLILYTHEHGDHFNPAILAAIAGKATIVAPKSVADKIPEAQKGQTKVMAPGDKLEAAGIQIEAVPANNTTADRAKYHPQGRDNGYVLTIGGKRIYIAGDTEETPEMKALKDIDAAFLPMNLPYTMDVNAAAQAVKDFKPRIVYPYHYQGSDPNAFKTAVGGAADVRLLKWY